jgi:hypothetical protein
MKTTRRTDTYTNSSGALAGARMMAFDLAVARARRDDTLEDDDMMLTDILEALTSESVEPRRR